MLQGMTAHYLLHSTFPVTKGSRCLVHAAAGGVGLILVVQMAKMIGAHVIGTAGSEEKAKLASEAGADEVIVYTQEMLCRNHSWSPDQISLPAQGRN
jgi:NADPH2:quinone reductase